MGETIPARFFRRKNGERCFLRKNGQTSARVWRHNISKKTSQANSQQQQLPAYSRFTITRVNRVDSSLHNNIIFSATDLATKTSAQAKALPAQYCADNIQSATEFACQAAIMSINIAINRTRTTATADPTAAALLDNTTARLRRRRRQQQQQQRRFSSSCTTCISREEDEARVKQQQQQQQQHQRIIMSIGSSSTTSATNTTSFTTEEFLNDLLLLSSSNNSTTTTSTSTTTTTSSIISRDTITTTTASLPSTAAAAAEKPEQEVTASRRWKYSTPPPPHPPSELTVVATVCCQRCGYSRQIQPQSQRQKKRRNSNTNKYNRRRRSPKSTYYSPPTTNNDDTYNYNDQSRSPSYIIPAEHPLKCLWDVLTIIWSIFNAYITHQSIRDRDFDKPKFLHSVCQIWFVVDMLLNFITEHKIHGNGKRGPRVLNTISSISARYLTTWFVIDILSLIPGEYLFVQPLLEQQKNRNFFTKWIKRSKNISICLKTNVLPNWKEIRSASFAYKKQFGFKAIRRLVWRVIKYLPKYIMFIKNMKAVVLMRLLRQVHWLRKLYFHLFLVNRQKNVIVYKPYDYDDETTSRTDDEYEDWDDDEEYEDERDEYEEYYDDDDYDERDDYDDVSNRESDLDDLRQRGAYYFQQHEEDEDDDSSYDEDADPY